MTDYNPLCEELPYWELESHILNHDGSVSSGIEISPLDIDCFDNDRINQLTGSLRSLVNTVPENYTLQLLVSTDSDFSKILDRHKNLINTKSEFLLDLDEYRQKRILDQIEKNDLQRTRIFLFLKSPQLQVKVGLFFRAVKYFSKNFNENFSNRLQELKESADSIKASLSSMGFSTKTLSKEDMVFLIYRYLNPERSKNIPAPEIFSPKEEEYDLESVNKEPELSLPSPRSQLVFGDLILDKDDFVLDNYRTRVLTLKTLPEITLSGQMKSFLKFDFHYDLLFTFKVSDQGKEIKTLERRRRTANSLSQARPGQVTDLENESKLSTTEGLLRELIDTGQRIFVSELSVILREENSKSGIKNLNQKSREVLSKFKTLSGAEAIQESYGAWKIFKSNMPGAPIRLERGKRMKTNNLVDFMPLYGPRLGDDIPVILLYNRQNSLLSLNPYDSSLSNYNALVTGASGSGKSFFNNCLLFQQVARGTKSFIIDIGGSYQKLTSLLDGQYFDVSLNEKYAINPFYIQDIEKGPSSEKLKGISSIIEQMVSDKDSKLSRLERVLIEKTLAETFERAKAKNEVPILSDFKNLCEISKEPELQKIAKLLYSWVGDAPYGRLLDRRASISTEKLVTTFDLRGLSQFPDLQSVMILIITNFILDQVENERSVLKRILLDEAWQHLQSPAATSFMEYAARTFRKTGSGITFITQAVDEIVASPIASAILNNTAMKVVMQQRGDINVLKDSLKLNEQEVALIQSLEQRKGVFSEAFMIEGDHRQVIRVFPTPLEYWASTSDSKDNLLLSSYQKDGLTLYESIKKASQEYPYGVSQKKSEVEVATV